MSKCYPVGYSAAGSAQYVEQLMSHDQTLIMDCRITAWSQVPMWRKDALVERWGKRYHYAGRYLGNAAHERNKQRRGQHIGDKPYPNEIEIANPEIGIHGLIQYLNEGHDLVLLCGCWDYYNCHLSEVTRLLVEQVPDIEIVRRDKPVATNIYPFVVGSFTECQMSCGKPSAWTYYPQGNKEHAIALCEAHRQQLQREAVQL